MAGGMFTLVTIARPVIPSVPCAREAGSSPSSRSSLSSTVPVCLIPGGGARQNARLQISRARTA